MRKMFWRSLGKQLTSWLVCITIVSCTIPINPAAPSPEIVTTNQVDLQELLLAPEQLPLGWLRETYIVYENTALNPPGAGTPRPVQQQSVTLTAIPAPQGEEQKGTVNASLEVRQIIWQYASAEAAAEAFTAEQEIWAQFTHEPQIEEITSQIPSYLFRYNASQSSGVIKSQYIAQYGPYLTKVDVWLEGQGGAYEWKTVLWEAQTRLIAGALPVE